MLFLFLHRNTQTPLETHQEESEPRIKVPNVKYCICYIHILYSAISTKIHKFGCSYCKKWSQVVEV